MTSFVYSNDPVANAPDEVARITSGSKTVAAMLADEKLKVDRIVYPKKIKDRLKDLHHQNYEAAAVDGFIAAMKIDAHQLVKKGAKRFDKTKLKITYMTADLEVMMECPDDDWLFEFRADLRPTCVNIGSLRRFPWETLIFGDRPIPGFPGFAQVPDLDHLVKVEASRGAIFGHIEHVDEKTTTIEQYKACLAPHLKDLQRLEKTSVLDVNFLLYHAEGLLEKSVDQAFWDAMPGEGAPETVDEVREVSVQTLGPLLHKRGLRLYLGTFPIDFGMELT